MTEETYTVEMTGEQAHELAVILSFMAQQVEGPDDPHLEQMELLAPVGKRCAEVAEEAGEWEG